MARNVYSDDREALTFFWSPNSSRPPLNLPTSCTDETSECMVRIIPGPRTLKCVSLCPLRTGCLVTQTQSTHPNPGIHPDLIIGEANATLCRNSTSWYSAFSPSLGLHLLLVIRDEFLGSPLGKVTGECPQCAAYVPTSG